jgi:lipooligosaccharide transport system ATP-binding protein
VQGECFGFLGPNGAGKTSTMRMLSCMSPRDGGVLEVLGLDPRSEPRRLKSRLGVVAQELNLDLELSVYENLVTYARYFEVPRAERDARARELLALVGLEDRAEDAVDKLSGGMKRRLQIARALVNRPDLVLLDEPTTGLDPQARRVVWDRLRELRRRGATLILTTHYMDEAEQLCDRIAIMDAGRVVHEGSPEATIRAVVGREVLELRAEGAVADDVIALLAPLARGHQRHRDLLVFHADDAEGLAAVVRDAGSRADFLAARRATLEDVFLSLTGRSLREGDPGDPA